MYGEKMIYVASIRPVKPSDGMNNITILIGEIRENLVERYGPGADEFFDDPKVFEILPPLEEWYKESWDELIA